ncbi:unnamed protein product [Polarella glacialis]|uniref:AAA+ ATPase domain-containing protein n=1 Tax=Polarella glacialis TaxID=89957 RepID=A0A813DQE9_POLGL|nr:unnamed protein product [Polarella glacialis]
MFLLSILGTAVLLCKVASSPAHHIWGTGIFCFGLLFCFASSTLYHSLFLYPITHRVLQILDHTAIYVLIAASYTPFLLFYSDQASHLDLLAAEWILCFLGTVAHLCSQYADWGTSRIYIAGELVLYLSMGWALLTVWDTFSTQLPANAVWFLLAGGVLYTAGVPFFLLADYRPIYHIIWHLFVAGAAILHWFAVKEAANDAFLHHSQGPFTPNIEWFNERLHHLTDELSKLHNETQDQGLYQTLLSHALLHGASLPNMSLLDVVRGWQAAKVMMTPDTGVKFEDVAGIDEAKEELTEIVDFLRAPERFVKVGAKIPKGVLLTGPPGTGKTLMAKALAGESGVPFIQASAAEFIELFVGVGASRVRDIFKQAKEKAPCIVFIDEIDAIGRQRGAGMGGGNDEREQTLNQILTEMDGFEGNTGVIVVAATNRADILDNALLRPGRFDRRVLVGLPDVKGREQILKVHVKNKKLAEDFSLADVARRTAGFSGADLENLMNESAILTARRNKSAITLDEINDATDRVIAGLAGRPLNDNASKKLIAYHEAGHALVGTLLPYHDPVNKVTLVPRGQAKGLTWFTPSEDQSLVSTSTFKARIAGALGGRAAERVVFGDSQVTTGAGGDLQQVERMARGMVTQFGMSDAVGSLALDDGGFTGPNYSEEVATSVDAAIKALSDEGYATALEIMCTHRACLDRLADELVEEETLSGDRLRELVAEYTKIPEKLAAV